MGTASAPTCCRSQERCIGSVMESVAPAGAAHSEGPMLSDELDSKPEVSDVTSSSTHPFTLLLLVLSDTDSDVYHIVLFYSSPTSSSCAAAGAVCAERLHPAGAGSGGLRLQALLFAAAGSGGDLAVQPAGTHRSLTGHL